MGPDEMVALKISELIHTSKLLGKNFKNNPDDMTDFLDEIASLELQKDLGDFGSWFEDTDDAEWCPRDARLLRNARLDAAAARYHSSHGRRFAWLAMSVAAKAYYASLVLLVLSIGQFAFIWYLVSKMSD